LELGNKTLGTKAYQTAWASLAALVSEQPDQINYRAALAKMYQEPVGFYLGTVGDFAGAETMSRRSSEIYAELVRLEPGKNAWVVNQSRVLCDLSRAMSRQGKRDEALVHVTRALELIGRSTQVYYSVRGPIFRQLAELRRVDAPDESDNLYRRAIQDMRALSARNDNDKNGEYLAITLFDAASAMELRHPAEAEQWLDESIGIFRELCGPTPLLRRRTCQLSGSLQRQAHLQQRLAANPATENGSIASAARLAKAEACFQEAIARMRQNAARFSHEFDRGILIDLIRDAAEFNLGRRADDDDTQADEAAAYKLRADALLTEAIQLSRALAAEFPDNTGYKSRLTVLEKLQAQHFGPKTNDE
jgi:tetratricopeptide (TPR) repeat protein